MNLLSVIYYFFSGSQNRPFVQRPVVQAQAHSQMNCVGNVSVLIGKYWNAKYRHLTDDRFVHAGQSAMVDE